MRESRGMKELALTNLYYGFDRPIIEDLSLLLEGDTPLERFQMFEINDAECGSLVRALPNVHKIKVLSLNFPYRVDVPKESLLRAFEQNSSLIQVHVLRCENANFIYLNAQDCARIDFYTKRNEYLPRLLEAPNNKEVPLSLRPRLLWIAKQWPTGPSLMFQFLVLFEKDGGQDETTRSKRLRVE